MQGLCNRIRTDCATAPIGTQRINKNRDSKRTGEFIMPRGKVKWFNTTRGYGFLTQEDGSDVFVHHSGIVADGYRSLADNEPVEFDIELQPNGKQALPLRLSLQEGAASGV